MTGTTKPTPAGRPAGGPGLGPGRGGGGMGMAMPVEKAQNFGPTFHRLLGRLRPERVKIGSVIVLALVSVGFSIAGPKLLGNATNLLFEGVVGKRLPAGVPIERIVADLRAKGENTQADMLAAMHV